MESLISELSVIIWSGKKDKFQEKVESCFLLWRCISLTVLTVRRVIIVPQHGLYAGMSALHFRVCTEPWVLQSGVRS